MNSSPSENTVSIPLLRRLLAKGILNAEEEREMEAAIRLQLPWRAWLDRGLLGFGTALILAGIVYFFAHNWDHLTNDDKLVLSGGAVLAAYLAAAWRGFENASGKAVLFAASALVGVFIAVFGQVYQTGADSYELFTAWAVLIFPWMVLGRFVPLWILWLAILNLAWGFYLPIDRFLIGTDDANLLRLEFLGLTVLNGTALLIREEVGRRGVTWLDRGWAPILLVAATMAPAACGVIFETIRTWDNNVTARAVWVATFGFAVLVMGLGYFFSRIRFSLAALAVITLATCAVLTFQAARVLTVGGGDHGASIFLLLGFVTLLIFGGGIFFLRSQRQANRS